MSNIVIEQLRALRLTPCVRIVVASNFQLEVAKNEQKIYKVI